MLLTLLKRFLGPYRGGLLIAVVLLQIVGGTMASLLLPTLNARIIDEGVAKGDTDFIWRTGGIMLAISLVQVVCTIAAVGCGARAAMSFGRDVRAAQFHRTLSFSAREMNHFGAPSLLTRNTNDVQQVQMLVVMTCTMVVAAPITMIGGVIMALREDPPGLSILVAVAVPVLALAIGLLIGRAGPLFRVMQTRIDAVNRILREQITGVRVVRAFVREPYEEQRFEVANAELTDTTTKVGRIMAALFPVVMLVMNLSQVAVLWFGPHRIASGGDLQIGQLSAFLTYLIQILMSVMMASMMFMIAPRAAVCAERIMEVLNTESSVVPPVDGVRTLPGRATVEFDNVSFCYPGADSPVLSNISFTAEPGTTTAVIGSTGSGKTTLISLIPRLFDATSGSVRVDGVDVREIEPETLWGRLGLVPQKAFLFSGTVAENLRYGAAEATDDQLWAALDVARATSSGRNPRAWTPPSPRAAPTCPAVSGSAWRLPAPGEAAGDLPVRRCLLRPGRGHRRPVAAGLGPVTADAAVITVRSGSPRSGARPDHRARGRSDGRPRPARGTAAHLRDVREIVASQLSVEEVA